MSLDDLNEKSNQELIEIIYNNSDHRFTWGMKAQARGILNDRQEDRQEKANRRQGRKQNLAIFISLIILIVGVLNFFREPIYEFIGSLPTNEEVKLDNKTNNNDNVKEPRDSH